MTRAIVTIVSNNYLHFARTLMQSVAQHVPDAVVHNVQSLVFKVPPGVDRNGLVARLRPQVETTLGTYAMSTGSYFAAKYQRPQPVSASLEASTITFPCFDGVDVDAVADAVEVALG